MASTGKGPFFKACASPPRLRSGDLLPCEHLLEAPLAELRHALGDLIAQHAADLQGLAHLLAGHLEHVAAAQGVHAPRIADHLS